MINYLRMFWNQASFTRAYELQVVNEIGPSKTSECFIWNPGPVSI